MQCHLQPSTVTEVFDKKAIVVCYFPVEVYINPLYIKYFKSSSVVYSFFSLVVYEFFGWKHFYGVKIFVSS